MLEVSQSQLLGIVLYALIIGFCLGMVYDILRILRISRELTADGERKGKKRTEHVLIFIEDILFWLMASLTVIVFVFHANEGKIRWFALAFTALGFVLYLLTVGRLVMRIASFIVVHIKRFFRFVKNRLLLPFLRFLAAVLTKMLHITGRFLNIFFRMYDTIRTKKETKRRKALYLAETSALFDRMSDEIG